MPPWLMIVVGLAAGLNLVSFAVYGYDKRQAKLGERRVPEKKLWLLILVGGFAGAWAGMSVFRHKTSKGSFLFPAVLCTLPWVGLAGLLVYNFAT